MQSVAFYYRVEGGEKSMTNARKIKEAIKQDLDSMTTEQLFAFCNLFEDARQYGISLNVPERA